MISDHVEFSELCGQRVTGVFLAEHVAGHTRRAVSLRLDSAQGRSVSLRCAGDGWGVVAERSVAPPTDLDEAGSIEVVDATGRENLGPGTIASVSALVTQEAAEPFGIRLAFTDGRASLVYNWGDELTIAQRFPRELGEVAYEPLCGQTTGSAR